MNFNSFLIGTVNTNSALKEAIANRNITLIRAPVGDKYIYEEMKKFKSMLGGENSGHIIIKKLTNTGDGVLTAICLMNILHMTNLGFTELLTGYQDYAIAQANIALTSTYRQTENVALLINKYTMEGARVVIRPSGTEPVLRIMVEHKDEKIANKMLSALVAFCKTYAKHR